MPFIVHGQNIDFSKNVQEQIKSASAAAPTAPVEEKRANIQSVSQLFEKTADQRLKEIAAARPIIGYKEPALSSSLEPVVEEKQTAATNYEVHKDVAIVRNKNKVAKRSQYLKDLLTFENK